VITKSDQENVHELEDLLKEEISTQYHPILDSWAKTGRLFQVKKPENREICQEGKEAILKALSCGSQRAITVNPSAIYPESVDKLLENIFLYIMETAFSSFIPKPNENILSSLLAAIDDVKGNVVKDNHGNNFWQRFDEHVDDIPAVKILRPLSTNYFVSAREKFQNNGFVLLKETVSSWESRYDALCLIIQNEMVKRIETISSDQTRTIRDKASPSNNVTDIINCEKRLKELRDLQLCNFRDVVMKCIEEDSELKTIVDRDPQCNKDLFDEAKTRFEQTALVNLVDGIQKQIAACIDLVSTQKDSMKLQNDVQLKEKEVMRLSDEVKEEKEKKLKLKNEIEEIRKQSSAHEEEVKRLKLEIEREREERLKAERQRLSSFSGMGTGTMMWPPLPCWSGGGGGGSFFPAASSGRSASSRPSWSEAFHMSRAGGGSCTQKEIAGMMNCSQSTVSRHFQEFK